MEEANFRHDSVWFPSIFALMSAWNGERNSLADYWAGRRTRRECSSKNIIKCTWKKKNARLNRTQQRTQSFSLLFFGRRQRNILHYTIISVISCWTHEKYPPRQMTNSTTILPRYRWTQLLWSRVEDVDEFSQKKPAILCNLISSLWQKRERASSRILQNFFDAIKRSSHERCRAIRQVNIRSVNLRRSRLVHKRQHRREEKPFQKLPLSFGVVVCCR